MEFSCDPVGTAGVTILETNYSEKSWVRANLVSVRNAERRWKVPGKTFYLEKATGC